MRVPNLPIWWYGWITCEVFFPLRRRILAQRHSVIGFRRSQINRVCGRFRFRQLKYYVIGPKRLYACANIFFTTTLFHNRTSSISYPVGGTVPTTIHCRPVNDRTFKCCHSEHATGLCWWFVIFSGAIFELSNGLICFCNRDGGVVGNYLVRFFVDVVSEVMRMSQMVFRRKHACDAVRLRHLNENIHA